jgi:hypothetical protein
MASGGEPAMTVKGSFEFAISVSDEALLTVRKNDSPSPLMGRFERLPDRVLFHPSLPLPPRQQFRIEWQEPGEKAHHRLFTTTALKETAPTVRMEPSGVPLPANALKFYLHFSEPMEQGVFLRHLRLKNADGREIVGPFREAELWSPDGRRLTVWFHPGRQKQGVNLNLDEGSVLEEGRTYHLEIAADWRSTSGSTMEAVTTFEFNVTAPDHILPAPSMIDFETPTVGSMEALVVQFDEPMDCGMLPGAVAITPPARGRITIDPDGRSWHFKPERPWSSRPHQLTIDPHLEDLAGNTFVKPFEVDRSKPALKQEPPGLSWSFQPQPAP